MAKKNVNENPNYRIITLEKSSSLAAEAYRRIKVGVEYANVDKKVQVIQLCSSIQGEGKTTVALNMAATYAEDEKKVLLIDLDFRRPKLHRAFNIENKDGTGLTDLLVGKIDKSVAIKHTDAKIDVINRGTKVTYPTSLLGSEQLELLIKDLRNEYDVIILDCPPILAVTDAAIISRLADGCLFVVSQIKTEKNAAKEAVNVLRQNNVNILGVVFAGVSTKGSDYYSSKYKYYYQDYNKDSE